jgi:hypothetical protein
VKNPSSTLPMAAFTVPPAPPALVAAAIAKFDLVADQWAATTGLIDDEKQAAVKAKADALHTAVAAAKDGKDASADIERVEREHAATIASLQVKAAALAIATDEQGNEMAVAIAEHRHEWAESLAVVASEAEVKYVAAIRAAMDALSALGPARGAVSWLTEFDHLQAVVGREQQFGSTRVFVDTTNLRKETAANPLDLLAVALTVVAPAVKAAAQSGHRGMPVRA